MKQTRLSAGFIVVRHTPDGWRYLLLRAYRYWDFSKGLVAAKETSLSAARRELVEETGISDVRLEWGEQYYETAPYAGGKIARYYLGRTDSEKVVFGINPQIGGPEHHEFRWLGRASAYRLLVPRLQAALEWAAQRLETSQYAIGEEAQR